jgi:uncharacterized protein
MWISELWRYPVKSMAGEKLESVEVREDGIAGDRVVHVRDNLRGTVVTSRSREKLLGHRATLGPDGEPLVDGRPWRSREVAKEVIAAAGKNVELARFDGVERFDILPLSVITDGAIRAFGHDARRLRPNIIIGGVPGLEERTWEGCVIRLGAVVIRAEALRARCIMTTFDPDTLEQNVDVLRHIRREFDGKLSLDCRVLEPGIVRVGDPVTTVQTGYRLG